MALRIEGVEVFEQAVLTTWPLFPRSRHCERSEAIHPPVCEVTMDCFAALAGENRTITGGDAWSTHVAVYDLKQLRIGSIPTSQLARGTQIPIAPAAPPDVP